MSLAAAGISLQQGAWIATIIAALVSAFLGVLKAVDWFEARAKK